MTEQLKRISWLFTDPTREVFGHLRKIYPLTGQEPRTCLRCGSRIAPPHTGRIFETRVRGTKWKDRAGFAIHTRCIPEAGKPLAPTIPARRLRRA